MALLIGAEEALKWSSPYWEPALAGALGGAAGWIGSHLPWGHGVKRPVITRGPNRLPPRKRPRRQPRRPPVIVGPGSGRSPKSPIGTPVPPYYPVPTRIKKRRKIKKTYTTTGRYVGPFRGARRLRAGIYAKHGCTLRVEAAGNVSQDKCVYIGHGTGATNQIAKIAFQAIVRRLATKVGFKPTSMDDKVNSSYTNALGLIGYRYTTVLSGQNSVLKTNTIPSGSTWNDVANQLNADFVNTFGSGSTNIDITEFYIAKYNDSVTPTIVDEHIMNARKLKCVFYVVSELKIQNRTKAHTEVGAETDAAAQSALNVENNPLEGKVYMKKGNLFKLKNQYQTGSSFQLVTGRDNAVIGTQDIDTSGLSTEQQSILSRPPSRYSFIGVNKEGRVTLGPGNIKSSVVTHRFKIGANKLFRSMTHLYDGSSDYFFACKSKMFAFEKMMHTDDADEPDMDIGYECNTTYKCAVYEKGSLFGIRQETV